MEKSKDKRTFLQKAIGNSVAVLIMIALGMGALYGIIFFAKKILGIF